MIKVFKNRSFRTIFLALFATATFVGSAIFVFDVDPGLMLQFFIASVIGVIVLMVAALCVTAFRILIKRWLNKKS